MLAGGSASAQTATVVNNATDPRHETSSQRIISVAFSNPLAGSTVAAQWTVMLDPDDAGASPAVAVPITGVLIVASTVQVQFDASAVAGHAGVQKFLKPGETLTVAFNNAGNTLTTAVSLNPVPSFAAISSKNNYTPTCGDVDLLNKGFYATVDQCAPVVMNFWQWTYEISMAYRNSTKFATNNLFFNMLWGDPANTSTNTNPFNSDNLGGAVPTFSSTGIKLTTQPVAYATVRPTFTYPAAYALPAPTSCEFTMKLTPFFSGLDHAEQKLTKHCFLPTIPITRIPVR